MITRALTLLTCLTLCAACTNSAAKDDPNAAETPTTMLDVHEVEVTKPDGGGFLTLRASGEVMLQDENAPLDPGHYTTVNPDGTVTKADGSTFLTLGADGELLEASGEPTGITIAADGTTTHPDMPKPLVFDEKGNMGEPGDMVMVEHVGGSDNPRARRAVALAFMSVFIYASAPEGRGGATEAMPAADQPRTRGVNRGSGGYGGVGSDDAEANPMEDEDPADQM
jgi:hypothetical protein